MSRRQDASKLKKSKRIEAPKDGEKSDVGGGGRCIAIRTEMCVAINNPEGCSSSRRGKTSSRCDGGRHAELAEN
jgi:hypothetical protein